MNSLYLFCLTLSLALANPPDLSGSYEHMINLTDRMYEDLTPRPTYFVVYYSIVGKDIQIGVVCESITPTSWCAFGVSKDGFMEFGDATLGWTDGVQQHVEDFALLGRDPPQVPCGNVVCPDSLTEDGCTNNVQFQSIVREDGYLTFEYSRPLETNDLPGPPCDLNITRSPIFLLASTGETILEDYPFNIVQHTYRLSTVFTNDFVNYTFIFPEEPTNTENTENTASDSQTSTSTTQDTVSSSTQDSATTQDTASQDTAPSQETTASQESTGSQDSTVSQESTASQDSTVSQESTASQASTASQESTASQATDSQTNSQETSQDTTQDSTPTRETSSSTSSFISVLLITMIVVMFAITRPQ